MAESYVDAYTQSLIDEGRARMVAEIRPLGTLSSEEAQKHWEDKDKAEQEAQAKVVRAPKRTTPKSSEGAQTK